MSVLLFIHDFIGAGRSGLTQGQLRNPDNPDQILESAAADKIRNYRDPYQRNRQVASLRHACLYLLIWTHPWRALGLDLHPLQQTGRRLL